MNKLKTTILSLCLILMCISIVSSVSAVGTPYMPDENGCFEMTVIENPSTGYHWELNEQASYGVKLVNNYAVTDNFGKLGAPVTQHFVFQNLDDVDGHLAVLDLVSPSGEIVKTLTSDMLN